MRFSSWLVNVNHSFGTFRPRRRSGAQRLALPAVFDIEKFESRVLMTVRLSAPSLNSPGSGEANVAAAPTYSWTQVTGNHGYRIAVSANAADLTTDAEQTGGNPANGFNVTVSQGTTSYSGTTLNANTTYFWRVHALGGNLAEAGNWSGQGSFTTAAPIVTRLSAPSLNSPGSGETNVAASPTFSWTQVAGDHGYRIVVSANAADLTTDPEQTGGNPANGFNVTVSQGTTSYSGTTLNTNTTYYWRVHALGGSLAEAGNWSSQGSFTTAAPIVTRLTAPTLNSPSSNATNVSTVPTFSWTQVTGNHGYRVVVSADAADLTTDPEQTGGNPANGFNVTVSQGTTSYSGSTLSASTTYFSRVHALGGSLAEAGNWSSQSSFTTAAPIVTRLLAPTLNSPSSNATNVSTTPTFSWTQVTSNHGYRIVVSTNAADLTTDPEQTGGHPANGFNMVVSQGTTSYSGTTLSANTTYFWRVHALGVTLAEAGVWSSQGSFTTAAPIVTRLLAPSLTSPSSRATNVSATPAFSWTQVTGNHGYRIVVSTNTADLTTDPEQTGGNPANGFNVTVAQGTIRYSSTTLSTSTTYYWRVHALGGTLAEAGVWSSQGSFTTAAPAPTLPAAPTGLMANATSTTKVSLTWQDNSNNETGFQIERKTGSTGRWLRIATVGVGIASYENSALTPGTAYFYRVRAVNPVGGSTYSNEASAVPAANGDSFEDDNTPANAKTIAINGSLQTHSINVNNDVDWVTFTLAQTSNVSIETNGVRGNTRMWLFGPDSSTPQIGFDDNSGVGNFSKIVRSGVNALGSGTYFVKVDENGNNTTIDSYSISVVATAFQVQSLALATETGAIHDWVPFHDGTAGGTVTTPGTETDDAFSFVSGINGNTTIQVAPTGSRHTLDPVFVVRDMTGATIALFNRQRGARNEVGVVHTESGRRYEIDVFGSGTTRGDYQLTIKQDSTYNPAGETLNLVGRVIDPLEDAGQIVKHSLVNQLLGAADRFGWSASETQRISAATHDLENSLDALGTIGDVLTAVDLLTAVGYVLSVGSGYRIEAWSHLIYSGLDAAAGNVGEAAGAVIGASVASIPGAVIGGIVGSWTVPYVVTNSYDALGRDAWLRLGVQLFGFGT